VQAHNSVTVFEGGPTDGAATVGRPSNRLFLLASLLILVLAASLRLYHLAQRSLWLDEAIAANISRGTISETLTLTRGFHSAPILDPLILYTVERMGTSPWAVRLPSVTTSLLAVMLMLCFANVPSIGSRAAGLSALMLAVSSAQIRYAQEVREYSLGVLYTGVLLYVYLSYVSHWGERKWQNLLYLTLFIAPFVQYGLVLLSAGILSAILVLDFIGRERGRRIAHLIIASGCLVAGGLLSFWLTLRYQWEGSASYLKDYYWTPGSNVLRFMVSNTHHLLTTLLLPGLAATLISVSAILIHLASAVRERTVPPLALITLTSCGTVLACALLRVYPYGAVRQCLFLAPVVCLFASVSLVQLADRFKGHRRTLAFCAMAAVVVISGALQIRLLKPYAEVEDIQQILQTLRTDRLPGDSVYVYAGAVPAVDYYLPQRDPHFMYGDFLLVPQEKYVSEMMGGLEPGGNRFWIVFSHVHGDDDHAILKVLDSGWKVEEALSAKGCALYLATRRTASAGEVASPSHSGSIETAGPTPAVDHTHDSFWAWNIRNARPSIR
jgi:hypothetical protein